MKKNIRIICLAIVIAISASGCMTILSTPDKTVQGFIRAFNKKDIRKALDYVEPSKAKGIAAMFSLAGNLTGFDIDSFIDIMPLLGTLVEETEGDVKLEYRISDVQIDGEYATVTGVEENTGEELVFNLILEEGIWYIEIDDLFN